MAVDLSMSVLVVDDYNTMIRIIRNLLKQLGFENIDDASDGSAALNKMRGKKYGLVISDWNMEPMTGYDLLREVRADPNLATTPFIMITAESKTENVIAAKKAGVNNYIVKPFNAATLKTKIEAVFEDDGHFRGLLVPGYYRPANRTCGGSAAAHRGARRAFRHCDASKGSRRFSHRQRARERGAQGAPHAAWPAGQRRSNRSVRG
jgi:two-component system, chemotaxis family, chemotaxis protein CheY